MILITAFSTIIFLKIVDRSMPEQKLFDIKLGILIYERLTPL